MALEATFRDLSVCLHHLHDALNALQVTLGDKPPDGESALADGVETAVLDMMGNAPRSAEGGAGCAQGRGASRGSGSSAARTDDLPAALSPDRAAVCRRSDVVRQAERIGPPGQ